MQEEEFSIRSVEPGFSEKLLFWQETFPIQTEEMSEVSKLSTQILVIEQYTLRVIECHSSRDNKKMIQWTIQVSS